MKSWSNNEVTRDHAFAQSGPSQIRKSEADIGRRRLHQPDGFCQIDRVERVVAKRRG